MKGQIKEGVETSVAKRQAIFTMLRGKSLSHVSRAHALFIPNLWLRLYGWEVDGKIWVQVDIEMDKITITPVNKEEALSMMEVNNVRPDIS